MKHAIDFYQIMTCQDRRQWFGFFPAGIRVVSICKDFADDSFSQAASTIHGREAGNSEHDVIREVQSVLHVNEKMNVNKNAYTCLNVGSFTMNMQDARIKTMNCVHARVSMHVCMHHIPNLGFRCKRSVM